MLCSLRSVPRPRFDRLEPARRDAIFDAAAAEFGEHGFERASYNRIIDRAGLSKGAMYYYFDDKRDLFVTMVDYAVTRVFDELEALGEVDDVAGFWARFREIMVAVWVRMLAEPRVMQLIPALVDPRNATDVPEAMKVIDERTTVWVEEMMQRGRAVKAVRDDLPDELLLSVTLSVGMSVDRWVAQRLIAQPPAESDDPAKLTGEMIDIVVDLMRRLLRPG